MLIEDLFAGQSVDLDKMIAHLERVAHKEGLPLAMRTKTYNSRMAQELGKWAETQGKGATFHNAIFRAYFVDGKNIGKIPELVDVAKSVGLSDADAKKILETGAFKEAVELDWARAKALCVTAVPTFVVNERILVGAQPYEAIEQLMKVSNVKKRLFHS